MTLQRPNWYISEGLPGPGPAQFYALRLPHDLQRAEPPDKRRLQRLAQLGRRILRVSRGCIAHMASEVASATVAEG